MSRRIAPPAFLVALALLLLAAASAQASPNRAAARAQGHSILVSALASGGFKQLAVRDARVRALSGGQVVARGRVGSQGMAILRTRGPRPSRLRIVVDGGRIGKHRFGGRIEAEVRGYRWPETIHVDFVTTLAARFWRAHRDTSLAQAKRRTKRFLELPPSYAIGLDGGADVAFDGRRFLAATTGRRYGRFVARLVRRMDNPKLHRSFAHLWGPLRRGAPIAQSSADVGAGALSSVAEAIAGGKGVFKVLEESAPLFEFANTALALDAAHHEAELKEEVEEIKEELEQVQESLAILKESVEDLKTQIQEQNYTTLAALAEGTQAGIAAAEDKLHSAAKVALQDHCTESGYQTAACEENRGTLTGHLGFAEQLERAQMTTPGEVNAYAELVGGTTMPEVPAHVEGLLQAASALTTNQPNQIFYTSSDSAELRAAASYWISSYTEGLVLASSYWGLTSHNHEAIADNVAEVHPDAAAMPPALPELLAPGTFIVLANGQMWPTAFTAQGGSSLPWGEMAAATWDYGAGAEQWVSSSGQTLGALHGGESHLPFANWKVAEIAQINGLLNLVTPKSGQMTGEAVVEQAGIVQEAITPVYGFDYASGLEMEYIEAGISSMGCKGSKWTCYWPVYVGNGVVGNFHQVSDTYGYGWGTFETHKFLDIEWVGQELWGYNNDGTIYGNAPYSSIPVLFYRTVGPSECYYYPASGVPNTGSPGCKG